MSGWDFRDDWLSLTKLTAFQPDSNGAFTDAEWLLMANSVLLNVMYPLLRKMEGEYYVETEDTTPVANQAEYDLPAEAYGGLVRDVTWLDSSSRGYSMVWKNLEDRDLYADSSYYAPSNNPPAFTIQGDKIVLLPAPASATGTLRVRYYRRPNKIVLSSETAKVSSVSFSTNTTITCTATVPSALTGSVTFDVISGFRTHEVRLDSQAGSGSGTDITVSGVDVTSSVSTGDYIALEGDSPLPMLPDALQGLFAKRVAYEALVNLGSGRSSQVLSDFRRDMAFILEAFEPRVKGQTQKIINWASHLRGRDSYQLRGSHPR